MKNMLTASVEHPDSVSRCAGNGADAVLAAVRGHSFTALADFDLAGLEQIRRQAGQCGLGFCVLMNRLYPQEDLSSLDRFLKQLQTLEPDGIYFADPAVALLADQYPLKSRLIYRPETLAASGRDAAWWLAQGIQAVSLSPLLTSREITEAARLCPEIEVTIHGRLLMSASRRRLLDAYQQKVRHPESLQNNKTLSIREETRPQHMPVYETALGTLVYTDFVQESFLELESFLRSGIHRFYLSGAFAPEQDHLDAVAAYHAVLNGEPAGDVRRRFLENHPSLPLSGGYYHQETIR
jgi:putative protease